MKYYIYCIKNKINNKKYIGQTVNIKKRWYEHTNLRKDRNKHMIIDKAINKYGKENFDYYIIDETDNNINADLLEKKYTLEYNTLKPKGYNIQKGGRNKHGSWNSIPIVVYKLDGTYIGEYESSSEFARIFPQYDERGVNCCRKGITKRYKDIMVYDKNKNIKIKPYINPINKDKRKKVYQFDFDGNLLNVFNSIQEATIKTNGNRTGIIGCCKGIYKQSKGYIWSYTTNVVINNPKYHKMAIIKQLDNNKNVINIFDNCKEAEERLNYKKNSYKLIHRHIKSGTKYMGYYWEKEKIVRQSCAKSKN